MDDDQSYHREDRWSQSYGPSGDATLEDTATEQGEIDEKTAEYLRSVQRHYEGQDLVNNPPHYNQGIETTDYIISNDMNFCEGNIVKYVTRYKIKGGVEDLKKAKWYLEKLIETTE